MTPTKQQLLDEITQALAHDIITPDDLQQFILTPVAQETAPQTAVPVTTPARHKTSLSAVEILFYIAGLILFAALVSIIVQSWEDGSFIEHFLLSGGAGMALWLIAYVLYRQPSSTILSGLTNSVLLTGSLSLLLGGFVILDEVVPHDGNTPFVALGVVLLCVGLLHLAYDRLVKNSIVLLLGILYTVAALPTMFFGILRDLDAPVGAWSSVIILGSIVLAATTRVMSAMDPNRPGLKQAFDSLAAFIALAAMYVASFGDGGAIWLIILIGSIIGLFYLSIVRRERPLLGSASVFLVIAIITIAFRYFSSFGVSFCLIIAAAGLLGTAAIAATINKKYFSSPQ